MNSIHLKRQAKSHKKLVKEEKIKTKGNKNNLEYEVPELSPKQMSVLELYLLH